jgi:hypothetical protein
MFVQIGWFAFTEISVVVDAVYRLLDYPTFITGAKRPMDTNVLALDTNGILRWIQTFLMAFYYRHDEMTMRRVRISYYI